MAKIIGNIVGVPNPKTDWNQTDPTKADYLMNKPTKVSQFENDAGYSKSEDVDKQIEDLQNVYIIQQETLDGVFGALSRLTPLYRITGATSYNFNFSESYNSEMCLSKEAGSISFAFGNDVYSRDYMSGIIFDSGETPTQISYTDSGILNWVGTDCTTVDGLSIFQPSANTHYDIVFYFNGTQFIGLVNGYVPSARNVVSV